MLPYPNFHPRNRFTNYSYKTNTRIQIGNDQGQDIPKVVSELAKKNMKSLLGPQSLTCLWVFDFFGRFPAWVISIIMNGAYDSFFISNLPFGREKASIRFEGVLNEIGAWPPQPSDTGIILYCFNQVITVLYLDLVIRRFLAGICLANLGYNGQFKITGSADSEWLSKSELNEIFKILPTESEKLADLCDSNLTTQQNVV